MGDQFNNTEQTIPEGFELRAFDPLLDQEWENTEWEEKTNIVRSTVSQIREFTWDQNTKFKNWKNNVSEKLTVQKDKIAPHFEILTSSLHTVQDTLNSKFGLIVSPVVVGTSAFILGFPFRKAVPRKAFVGYTAGMIASSFIFYPKFSNEIVKLSYDYTTQQKSTDIPNVKEFLPKIRLFSSEAQQEDNENKKIKK